jgi:lipoprotein-anchoring transpeptidase ErfK/SrfK
VHVAVAARGVTAGPGFVFANGVSLDFRTGAAQIATVDDRTHRLTLVRDGKVAGSYPVSLGSTSTPTRRGTKVVMSKGNSICMSGPGFHECGVKYTQQLTDSGEYLVSSPWHEWAIGRTDVSTGCTDLRPADAQALFATLRVGDVVDFPNATGAPMRFGDGFGDWDVTWTTWLTGGAVPTR